MNGVVALKDTDDEKVEPKINLKNQFVRGNLMKNMCKNVCYLIIITIMIGAMVNFGLDVK